MSEVKQAAELYAGESEEETYDRWRENLRSLLTRKYQLKIQETKRPSAKDELRAELREALRALPDAGDFSSCDEFLRQKFLSWESRYNDSDNYPEGPDGGCGFAYRAAM